MEEIICPQCGRPNLIEAIKCWYCQTILENKTGESEKNISTIPNGNRDKIETKANSGEETHVDQNIPEWLKHIRDLKEADQPPEEKDPNWQQQDLFSPEEKLQQQKSREKRQSSSKEKIAQLDSKRKKDDDPLIKTEQEKRSKQANNANMQKNHAMEKPDKNSETLSDDLPEGFTEL